MEIVCLGWGSLVWDSQNLNLTKDKWHSDGPALPVEFSRYSDNGRVTLIIDKEARPIQVLWAELELEDLNMAIHLLAKRENTNEKNIESIRVNQNDQDPIRKEIINWLRNKKMDAAIWTGLSYKNPGRPTIDEVLNYLKKLEGRTRDVAEEYIRRAPEQIRTEYRMRIEAEFGWTFKDL